MTRQPSPAPTRSSSRLASSSRGLGCDNSVDEVVPDPLATPEGWTLVWADEFDGTARSTTSKWSLQLGDGCPSLCGWGNNELQVYTADNYTVADGLPHDHGARGGATAPTRRRGCARCGKGDWTYGRFEVRAKLPTGAGPVARHLDVLQRRHLRRLGGLWRDRHHGEHRQRARRGLRDAPLRRPGPGERVLRRRVQARLGHLRRRLLRLHRRVGGGRDPVVRQQRAVPDADLGRLVHDGQRRPGGPVRPRLLHAPERRRRRQPPGQPGRDDGLPADDARWTTSASTSAK